MMQTIYTSYFGNARNFDPNKFAVIGIAGKSPKGWTGLEYKQLAPLWSIWKEWHDAMEDAVLIPNIEDQETSRKSACERYVKRFQKEILANRNPETVITNIFKLANGKVPVLCCYEKSGQFCHRHLVTQWLKEYVQRKGLDIQIQEYGQITVIDPGCCKGCMWFKPTDGFRKCTNIHRLTKIFKDGILEMADIYSNWNRSSKEGFIFESLPNTIRNFSEKLNNAADFLLDYQKTGAMDCLTCGGIIVDEYCPFHEGNDSN